MSTYIKLCPKCGSSNWHQESESVYTGDPGFYVCNQCGFSGKVFPEVEMETEASEDPEKHESKQQGTQSSAQVKGNFSKRVSYHTRNVLVVLILLALIAVVFVVIFFSWFVALIFGVVLSVLAFIVRLVRPKH